MLVDVHFAVGDETKFSTDNRVIAGFNLYAPCSGGHLAVANYIRQAWLLVHDLL